MVHVSERDTGLKIERALVTVQIHMLTTVSHKVIYKNLDLLTTTKAELASQAAMEMRKKAGLLNFS